VSLAPAGVWWIWRCAVVFSFPLLSCSIDSHPRFLQVYMYRLLIEYNRIINRDDNNLNSMDM
jgi:hypothetical protein